VDIIGAIKDAPLVDLGVLFGLALFVIVGVLQGPIRRLIGIASMLVAFLFAANLRDTVGDFLAGNWRQFDLDYNRLLAFLILFVVITVAASVATQGFYRRVDVSVEHPIVDDVLGGVAGFLEGVLVLVLMVIILSSFPLPPAKDGDLGQVRTLQDMLVHQSHIVGWLNDYVAPIVVHLFSPLLPGDLNAVYP
jgi:uncharacterized membrane protein required for colicin V production